MICFWRRSRGAETPIARVRRVDRLFDATVDRLHDALADMDQVLAKLARMIEGLDDEVDAKRRDKRK